MLRLFLDRFDGDIDDCSLGGFRLQSTTTTHCWIYPWRGGPARLRIQRSIAAHSIKHALFEGMMCGQSTFGVISDAA